MHNIIIYNKQSIRKGWFVAYQDLNKKENWFCQDMAFKMDSLTRGIERMHITSRKKGCVCKFHNDY